MPLTKLDDLKTPKAAMQVTDMFRELYKVAPSAAALVDAKMPVINARQPPKGLASLKADMTTDDAPALQAMVDYLGHGGTIYIPAGEYRLESPIVLPQQVSTNTLLGVTLIGAGVKSTVLYSYNNTGAIQALGSTTGTCNFVIRDLTLTKPYAESFPDSIGIDMAYNYEYALVENVRMENHKIGIRIANNRNACIKNAIIYESTEAGVKIESTANGVTLLSCALRSGYDGVYMQGSSHTIVGCDIVGNTHTAITAVGVIGLTINGSVDASAVSSAGIYIDSCRGVEISGIAFIYLAANAKGIWVNASEGVTIRGFNTFRTKSGGYAAGSEGIRIISGINIVVEACTLSRCAIGLYIKDMSGRVAAVDFYGCYQNFYIVTASTMRVAWQIESKHLRLTSDSGTSAVAVVFPIETMINSYFDFLDIRRFGSTSVRPTYVYNGLQYYDTTLLKPIFYYNTAWRDANGTVV